jgi:penicillin-binding protein 1A
VTVLDMTAAYAVFPNNGKRASPYAAYEIRNSQAELIYSRDRDEPQPQILEPRVVQDMNLMLSKVVEEGTAKRAALEGIRTAGKTGTTNGYRDAWYVGYSGNLVAGAWFGNDDHTSTNNMTGGSLPAMLWKEVMTVAHQNMELRPIPGLSPDPTMPVAFASGRSQAAQGAADPNATSSLTTGTLSRRSYDVIDGIGDLFRSVDRPGQAQQTGLSTGSTAPAGASSPAGSPPPGGRPAVNRVAMP